MELWEAVFLGAVQGLAEFLPVSSSGHLVVIKELMGLDMPRAFDILLHIPTLLAVIIVFHKRLLKLFSAFFKWIAKGFKVSSLEDEDQHQLKLIVAIIIATVVTVPTALVLDKGFGILEIPAKFVGVFFIITAVILFCTRFIKSDKEYKDFGLKGALITGLAQGLGAIPGISRSGSSISGALLGGLRRDLAGEYAFLISIPAILGATVYKFKDMGALNVPMLTLIAGLVSSFVVGILSLLLLMRFVKKGKLYYFSFYLVAIGITSIIFL